MMRHDRSVCWVGLAALLLAACGSVVETPDDGGGGDLGRDGDGGYDGDAGREDAGDEDDGEEMPEDGGPSDVVAVCRNGVVEPPEECDDGNATPDDGCEPDCTWTCETAGDCDDGEYCNGEERCADHDCMDGVPPVDGTPCTLDGSDPGVCRTGLCVPATCGDGHLDGEEECDDGNEDNTDDCLSDCRDAFCGDGYVWRDHEVCDGDDVPCTSSCDSPGVRACTDECVLAEICTPPAEVCNGLDDDCDETCDNGFPCCSGEVRSETDPGGCRYSETCDASCAWGPRVWEGAAPGNDACATATTITPSALGTARLAGSTCAAADDYRPSCVPPADGAPDVVYRFELTGQSYVRLSTRGSSFDTVLAVYRTTTAACPGLEVVCNDDAPSSEGTGWSEIAQTFTAGTYYVVVDGRDGARGAVSLEVGIFEEPTNDDCDDARLLTADNSVQTTRVSTTEGATDDGATCTGPGGTVVGAGRDVWFRIPIGTGRHWVYLDLLDGAEWNGMLRVYDACPTEASSPPLACQTTAACSTSRPKWFGLLGTNDPASRTIYVAVDGLSPTDVGPFRLSYQVVDSACTPAVPLYSSGLYTGITDPAGAALRTSGTCGGLGAESMYVFAPCAGRPFSASTCYPATDFDSVLYLRNLGCGLASTPGSELACNTTRPADCSFANGTAISLGGSAVRTGLHFLFVDSDAVSVTTGNFQVHVTL